MAICVCEADHETDDAEKTFLRDLAAALGLAAPAAAALVATTDAVAAAEPGASEPFLLPSLPPALPLAAAAPGAALKPEVDSLVLRYSILNRALELLPETLATMAILPLQIPPADPAASRHARREKRARHGPRPVSGRLPAVSAFLTRAPGCPILESNPMKRFLSLPLVAALAAPLSAAEKGPGATVIADRTRFFEAADRNDDGSLSRDEAAALGLSAPTLRALFRKCDRNFDRKISLPEFLAPSVKRMPIPIPGDPIVDPPPPADPLSVTQFRAATCRPQGQRRLRIRTRQIRRHFLFNRFPQRVIFRS